jgi:hypothetical protein
MRSIRDGAITSKRKDSDGKAIGAGVGIRGGCCVTWDAMLIGRVVNVTESGSSEIPDASGRVFR